MDRLDKLPEVSDQVLSGLRADDRLKYKILQKATEPEAEKHPLGFRKPVIALSALTAVMVAVFALMAPISPSSAPSERIHTISAGNIVPESPVNMREIITRASRSMKQAQETESPAPTESPEPAEAPAE